EAVAEGAFGVGDGEVGDSRVSGKEFVVFGGGGEDDAGVREALFGGVEQDAGDGDVGAEGDTGENADGSGRGIGGDWVGMADSLVAGFEIGSDGGGEEVRVGVAEGGVEAVREAFGEDAEERGRSGVFE